MGLDVYKRQVVKPQSSDRGNTIDLFADETNKSMIALFDKFKDYVVEQDIEVDDWEVTFAKLGLENKDWEWCCTMWDEEKGEVIVEFTNSITYESIKISDIVTKFVKVKQLSYIEVGYQRKQMSPAFYTEFLSGCWYVSEDTENDKDDSPDYVFTQQELNRAKSYADEQAPIHEWTLGEDEFVYFSY